MKHFLTFIFTLSLISLGGSIAYGDILSYLLESEDYYYIASDKCIKDVNDTVYYSETTTDNRILGIEPIYYNHDGHVMPVLFVLFNGDFIESVEYVTFNIGDTSFKCKCKAPTLVGDETSPSKYEQILVYLPDPSSIVLFQKVDEYGKIGVSLIGDDDISFMISIDNTEKFRRIYNEYIKHGGLNQGVDSLTEKYPIEINPIEPELTKSKIKMLSERINELENENESFNNQIKNNNSIDLEEMTVKEIKELRDKINEILNSEDNQKSEQAGYSNVIDLNVWNNEYLAALSWILLEKSVKDPYSLEINEIMLGTNGYENGYGVMRNVPSVKITCHANNSYGNSVIGEYYIMQWSYNVDPQKFTSTFPVLQDDIIPNNDFLVLGTDYEGFDYQFVGTKKLNIDTVRAYVDALKKDGAY